MTDMTASEINNKGLNFSPSLDDFIKDRLGAPYTTLSGSNNSGKSLVLKNLRNSLGRDAYMAGPQRFYHITDLATQQYSKSDYDSWHHDFRNQLAQNVEFNYEHNILDLGRIIGGLNDTKRSALFKICGEMIGCTFSLKRRDPDNELSPRYVDMDGLGLSAASTGTRLLMTLLGLCLDDEFSVLLIDEPELGLSPRLQGQLARFLSDQSQRAALFPHLKSVFVATHSHLMLDKKDVTNNFTVARQGAHVDLTQITSVSALHNLQFNMLGNSLEDLFLPAAIIICEGKTDKPFIERAVQIRYPGRRVLVLESQGDVKRTFKSLCQSLGDIRKSPFQARIFIVLDLVHTAGTVEILQKLGAIPDNIVVWSKNGIEYVYPPDALAEAFACSVTALEHLTVESDNLLLGATSIRKVDLSTTIISGLNVSSVHNEEFEKKLLSPLGVVLG